MEQIPFLQKLLGKDGSGKKSNWLFALGLAGILLIFLSGFFPSQKQAVKTKEQSAVQTEQEYINTLESKLKAMLEKTSGVGNVEVMITLESSSAVIYAQDEESDTQTSTASEQENSQKNAYKTEHVFVEDSGEKKPLVETSIAPEIKGVAIVCSGGGDISVIKNVTDLVSALLAVPTNRICVTKMI